MRAVVIEEFGATPLLRSVPDPDCPVGGAVIRVEASGVCRSDWHGWLGHDPDIALPHVPGHEFAGVLVEVGRDVPGWRAGQRVTVPFVCACGNCEPCRAGDGQVCDRQSQPGFTRWGSFAELVAIDYAGTNLVQLPDGLDAVSAASLGCRFATAYRAVVAHGQVRPGTWLAVHGCGGVGLSAVMIGAAHGASVVAVDVRADALELARSFGAAAVVDASAGDVPAAVREVTGGGAHVSLDALGSLATCANSVRSLRKRGRHVQVGLLLGGDATTPVPMNEVIANELEIVGSHGMPAHAYPAMLDEVVTGTLRPQLLVGHVITLEAAPQALVAMSGPAPAGATVVLPNEAARMSG